MRKRGVSPVITATTVGLLLVTSLLVAVPAFADPPPWAPAHGWRNKHQDEDRQGEDEDAEAQDEDRRGDDDHKQGHRYVGYGGVPWENDYGVIDGTCNRAAVGAVVGAALGGLIGSQVVGDRNRPVAVIIGSVLGAVVGHQIGQDLDDGDRGCIGHALELAPDGHSVHWVNDVTGVNYIITPVGPWRSGGASCRQFTVRASHGERSNVSSGRACRSGDGVWQMR